MTSAATEVRPTLLLCFQPLVHHSEISSANRGLLLHEVIPGKCQDRSTHSLQFSPAPQQAGSDQVSTACLELPHSNTTQPGRGLSSYFPSYLRFNVLISISGTPQSPKHSFALTVSTMQRRMMQPGFQRSYTCHTM